LHQKRSLASAISPAAPKPATPWRDRPLLPLKVAAEIVGVSVGSLYRFADEGRLKFRTLAGRTLVDTKSLIVLADSAQDWTPKDVGKEARAKRKHVAAEALR
jgi:hypothetical protein